MWFPMRPHKAQAAELSKMAGCMGTFMLVPQIRVPPDFSIGGVQCPLHQWEVDVKEGIKNFLAYSENHTASPDHPPPEMTLDQKHLTVDSYFNFHCQTHKQIKKHKANSQKILTTVWSTEV